MARVPTVTFYRGTARIIVNDTEEGRARAAAQGFTATEPSGSPAAADVASSPAETVGGPEPAGVPGDTVGDPAPSGEAETGDAAAPADLAAMSVRDLRAYARDHGVPLGAGITTRDQILEVLTAADTAQD